VEWSGGKQTMEGERESLSWSDMVLTRVEWGRAGYEVEMRYVVVMLVGWLVD
jgi:hypothetical protein